MTTSVNILTKISSSETKEEASNWIKGLKSQPHNHNFQFGTVFTTMSEHSANFASFCDDAWWHSNGVWRPRSIRRYENKDLGGE